MARQLHGVLMDDTMMEKCSGRHAPNAAKIETASDQFQTIFCKDANGCDDINATGG